MNFWLIKQEPTEFSWDDFVAAGVAIWDGVRNYQARNNLKAMTIGDPTLFYHSVEGKCVVGIAKVSREWFPDPTDEKWASVEFVPIKPLQKHVTLEAVKAEPLLANIHLVRQGRLSVMALTEEEFNKIVEMGETSYA